MGTWGVGIFADDTAADVRGDWRDLLGEGLSSEAATERLLDAWKGSLADPDEGPVVWLALAAAQVRTGRLTPRVRREALAIIDSGAGLRRWAGTPNLKKRQAVLHKLQGEILGSQKVPVRVPKRRVAVPRFEVGDVVSFRLANGIMSLLRCYRLHTDQGGSYSLLELLDWFTTEVPDGLTVQTLPRRMHRSERVQAAQPAVYLPLETPRTHPYPADRITLVARGVPGTDVRAAFSVLPWSRMDHEISLQLDPTWKPDPAAQDKYEASLRQYRERARLEQQGQVNGMTSQE